MIDIKTKEKILRSGLAKEIYEGRINIDGKWHFGVWYEHNGKMIGYVRMKYGVSVIMFCQKNVVLDVWKIFRIVDGNIRVDDAKKYFFMMRGDIDGE